MRKDIKLFCSTAIAVLGCGLAAETAFAADAQTEATEPSALAGDEIILTAQRRAEKSQDFPIAITAFSNEDLQKQNLSTGQDLMGKGASLTVNANGQGTRTTEGRV